MWAGFQLGNNRVAINPDVARELMSITGAEQGTLSSYRLIAAVCAEKNKSCQHGCLQAQL